MLKIIVKDIDTGEYLKGDFSIINGKIWQVDFGSYNAVNNPTRAWNGEANLIEIDRDLSIQIVTL